MRQSGCDLWVLRGAATPPLPVSAHPFSGVLLVESLGWAPAFAHPLKLGAFGPHEKDCSWSALLRTP